MPRKVDHIIPVRIVPVRLTAEVRDRLSDRIPEDVADPFVFTAESSNNNLDSYYTHMSERTLRNFARDATAGVQFLDSHNNRNLGYGRTFDGRFEVVSDRKPDYTIRGRAVELAIDPPSEFQRVLIDTYTIPGINFGGGLTYASTDDFIAAVRARIAEDISVGFGGGDWRCDICGGNYRSWNSCPHLAGFEYEIGEQGERTVLATVEIDGASLYEHSAVYDGATPEAMITKAERLAAAGELEPEKIRLFEQRHNVELPRRSIHPAPDMTAVDGLTSIAGAYPEITAAEVEKALASIQRGRSALPQREERPGAKGLADARRHARASAETQGETHMNLEELVNDVRSILAETGAPETADVPEQVRWLAGEVERLRPLADDGVAYRNDLVEEALAEGVRAHGEEFAQESYRGILESSSIETIKCMRDDWKAVGDARFREQPSIIEEEPEGSNENAEDPPQAVPDEAFAD